MEKSSEGKALVGPGPESRRSTWGRYVLLLCMVICLFQILFNRPTDPQGLEIRSGSPRRGCNLPDWVKGGPELMAKEIQRGSHGLTDKAMGRHSYEYVYHPYMSNMVQRMACHRTNRTLRLLEIGLGCAPGGGMIKQSPGGSSLAWRHLFANIESLSLDLHIMEYAQDCANKWAAKNPTVKVHTGDASSPADLTRVMGESGGAPFDIVIDDASHINWHQIATLEFMIHHVAPGGFYVIEDIHSSCTNWAANLGTKSGQNVGGGGVDCMTTTTGNATIFAKIVEWQKKLVVKQEPFPGVTHIDLHKEAVVFEKQLKSL